MGWPSFIVFSFCATVYSDRNPEGKRIHLAAAQAVSFNMLFSSTLLYII